MEFAMTQESTNTPSISKTAEKLVRRFNRSRAVEVVGTKFGRTIEASIKEIRADHSHLVLNVRRRKQAVVMDYDDYSAIEELVKIAETLVKRNKQLELSAKADKFENLLDLMQTQSSKKAVDMLFNDDLDLSQTYLPGATEIQ